MRLYLAVLLFCVIGMCSLPGEILAQQGTLLSPYAEALQQQSAQTGGLVTCLAGDECNFCDLGQMINNIINWLFGFLTVVAVLVFAAAGFKLVTSGGDTTARDWAKARFTYVIIGFLLMFASWLIVDTILRGLTGSDQGMSVWGSFDVENCGEQRDPRDAGYTQHGLNTPDSGSGESDNSGGANTWTGGEVTADESRPGEPINGDPSSNYSDDERARLANQIISEGDDAFGTTELMIDGECMEVMNDSPTLANGTYVPFTYDEANRMASQWGWQIPTNRQALAIRNYAESQGNVYRGITRSNDSAVDQQGSITALLNDGEMVARARRGRGELINGHFKWYVREGGTMQITGLSKGGGKYWQPLSDAHSSDSSYVDYSHGVRLVRPCQ